MTLLVETSQPSGKTMMSAPNLDTECLPLESVVMSTLLAKNVMHAESADIDITAAVLNGLLNKLAPAKV